MRRYRSNRRSRQLIRSLHQTTFRAIAVGLPVTAFIGASPASAQSSTVPLPTINVEGASSQVVQPGAAPAGPTLIGTKTDTPATAYQVDSQGADLASGGGGTNTFRAVSLLPSVDAPAIDPYGFANIPGGNKGIRVRGELSQHGNSISSVDGVPVIGINPGMGTQWLIANENLAGLDLYQGPIPPNRLAFFTTAGVIDSRLRWPEAKAGFTFSQSFGSDAFMRSFLRADSGKVWNNTTAFFVSGSWTDANKWRGWGESPDGMKDIAVGVSSQITDAFDAKAFFAYSDTKQNTYRALTYPQAINLNQYRYFDFLPFSSSVPSEAVNYYNYNRQSFRDWLILTELTYKFDETTKLVIKPYYFKEEGYYLDGMTNGRVRNWLIDHDAYGVVGELQTRALDWDVKLGYWWSSLQPPGPPTAWKTYAPTSWGGLTNASWAILADDTSRHEFNSPYALVDRRFGPLRVQFGGRYIRETFPGMNEYSTTGIGDVSYDTALSMSPGIIANRSVGSRSVDAFLPFTSLSYDVTPDFQLRASAGQNYGAPSFDVWPAFQQNSAAFLARGLTAQSLWSSIKPEISTGVDAGFRMTFGQDGGINLGGLNLGTASIEPTFYYAQFRNKSVAYDSGLGLMYSQNVADSEGYGVQLVGRWLPTENLSFFGSLAYNRNVFRNDLPTLPGASASAVAAASVSGLQLPDVPLWSAALGAQWTYRGFAFTPVLRYIGSRYGDAAHQQPISGYTLVDLNFSYEHKLDWGSLTASLSVTNLFDKAYIGQISSGYYQSTSNSGGIYYPGAPRTIWGRLTLNI